MIYVGVDLHKKYVTACALDSQGQVIATERRLATTEGALLTWLSAFQAPVAVALEATLHWAWVPDPLTAAGYAVTVAHPYQVKLISHARCKTDPIDARKLADLLRTNLLPAIWVPDAATRARRTLLRGRAYLVRLRTQLKNRIHGYLAEANLRVDATDLYGRAGRGWPPTSHQALVPSCTQRRMKTFFCPLTPRSRLLDRRPNATQDHARGPR